MHTWEMANHSFSTPFGPKMALNALKYPVLWTDHENMSMSMCTKSVIVDIVMRNKDFQYLYTVFSLIKDKNGTWTNSLILFAELLE